MTGLSLAARLALLLAVLIGLLGTHWRAYSVGARHERDAAQVAIQKLQLDAAATLAAETAKTRSAEQALATAKNHQELQDATHQKTIANFSDRLRRSAGPAGRLLDPHATPCRGSGDRPQSDPAAAPVAGAADPAQAGGALSAELTELLQRITRDADEINAAYASCRADAYTVRQLE